MCILIVNKNISQNWKIGFIMASFWDGAAGCEGSRKTLLSTVHFKEYIIKILWGGVRGLVMYLAYKIVNVTVIIYYNVRERVRLKN